MNKQNIYENVRYYIGKITVILMMVLFPFVMTDKLNNCLLYTSPSPRDTR